MNVIVGQGLRALTPSEATVCYLVLCCRYGLELDEFLGSMQSHYWYSLLDRMVMPSCSTGAVSVVTKMLADQLLWAPANTVAFYAFLAVAEGHLGDLGFILQAKLLPTVLAGYALWPLAHVINFRYAPPSCMLDSLACQCADL